MARGWIHTVYRAGRWVNEIEGGLILGSYQSQDEAIRVGRREARVRRTEHLIHRVDGTIRERNSYGSDSFPPRG